MSVYTAQLAVPATTRRREGKNPAASEQRRRLRAATRAATDALPTVGVAEEGDLVELARIAAFNFENAKNYQRLPPRVVARFIERNSAENLRLKLNSSRHRIVVAREGASARPVGFCITKLLGGNAAMGTRLHVSPTRGTGRVAPAIHSYVIDLLRREGRELLYGEVSGDGHALKVFFRAGFLYVDSYANRLVPSARIDRVVYDLLARDGSALSESAYLPLLSPGSTYGSFVKEYGLLVERLFTKVERMHLTGRSGISQSVFGHVENGLRLIRELREQLGGSFAKRVHWDELETMWIFHDIGEIGSDHDIPSYKKTKSAQLEEGRKAQRILESVQPRALRSILIQNHARYLEQKAGTAAAPSDELDAEAVLCAFVDKLEAAEFIGSSGIGEVWRRRAGRPIFEWIIRRHALGAFIDPLARLRPLLDETARLYLLDRLTGIVRLYHDRDLVSKRFAAQRVSAIAAALGYDIGTLPEYAEYARAGRRRTIGAWFGPRPAARPCAG